MGIISQWKNGAEAMFVMQFVAMYNMHGCILQFCNLQDKIASQE